MKNLILELSLKPFYGPHEDAVRSVVRKVLHQWRALIDQAETLSFLFWSSDGSELLDYQGDLQGTFEWAKWVGVANENSHKWDPEKRCLHSRGRLYRADAPEMTYARLKEIVQILRSESQDLCGKKISIGTTFDPGPEFAKSSFKYERHPEICSGNTMGAKQWVHCGARLAGDQRKYAAFPSGIPDDITIGHFLGAQLRHFAADLGFDYIWLSNGFGYSLDSWSVTGEVFDGTVFDVAAADKVRCVILDFWRDFREQCPDLPIHTRGSNLSTAMDLASDGSPVREIFEGFNPVAPVNSPWAALTGDYGLELVGWLSHIAELPENGIVPFRYYLHDPWWLNSPWLDRYGREPHDIYLPLSCARVRPDASLQPPDSVAFLTIDDSYGQLPDQVPMEVTPHISAALRDFPDEPGLVTWIYPFEEYHRWAASDRVSEVFFGDWFIRTAINMGFPLNTVVSTKNFLEVQRSRPQFFLETILTCPAPESGSDLAKSLVLHLQAGGKVLLYGPLDHLDPELRDLLQVRESTTIAGHLDLSHSLEPDVIEEGSFPRTVVLRELLSGGGVGTVSKHGDCSHRILAEVSTGTEKRLFAVESELPSGGVVAWLRGALSATVRPHTRLPDPDDALTIFHPERMMRWMVNQFGWNLRVRKPSLKTVDPIVLAARKKNAWFFSGFSPSTNVTLEWNSPMGAPVPVGCDVLMKGTRGATMVLPRAWHRECRVFVRQESGEVSCVEHFSGEVGVSRRILVKGLANAELTFLPDTSFSTEVAITWHDAPLGFGTPVPSRFDKQTRRYSAEAISGDILISW